ncbi:unnamed protein product, partial [marine sediment metagenome]
SLISEVSRIYRVHLSIDPAILDAVDTTPETIELLCKQAFFLLNKSRNWGELFLFPKAISRTTKQLCGSIEIDHAKNAKRILGEIREDIENYIFPRIKQNGYETLSKEGIETNEIFNGPVLENGWIKDEALGEITSTIRTEEIGQIIANIKGVNYVDNLSFRLSEEVTELTAKKNELITFEWLNAIKDQSLVITSKGEDVYFGANSGLEVSIGARALNLEDIDSSIQIQPDLPEGSYREID